MLQLLIGDASEARALAELLRGKLLRGEGGDVADVVSVERRADAAIEALEFAA